MTSTISAFVGPVTLVVGRDTRASGPELQSALMQGLSDERVRIMDLDVAPTPTIQFALGALKAHGAVAVTAKKPFFVIDTVPSGAPVFAST